MKTILAALLLCACHHAAAPPAPPENTAPEDLTLGYVLVSESAWLRSAPHDDALGARAEAFDPKEAENIERVWVARQVADEDDWLEIENLNGYETGPHCYGSIDGLGAFKLRLHVRRSDLATVTTRELEMNYDDGSGVTLSAGVALQPAGDAYRIGVDSIHPELKLDAENVGLSYLSPSAHFDDGEDPEDEDDPSHLEMPDGVFSVDGVQMDLPSGAEPAEIDREDPQRPIVTVNLSCSMYRGVVDSSMGYGVGPMGYGERGYGQITDLPEIRAGAKLTWPDGSPAGESIYQYQVYWGAPNGCFRVPLRERDTDWKGTEEWFLTLCAAEGDWIAGYGG